jgi:hypothetical protein
VTNRCGDEIVRRLRSQFSQIQETKTSVGIEGAENLRIDIGSGARRGERLYNIPQSAFF